MNLEIIKSEDVLMTVKTRGPLIPLDVRKVIGKGDSITIGAALSDLVQKKLVRVTNVKRGGSPFYYVSGQEPKLENLGQYLNEKDKRTFERLRNQKIIRDKTQDPLTRVCVRNIKDFSRQIEFEHNGEKEIFWRWYLIPEDQAITMIKQGLGLIKKPEPKPEEKKATEEQKPVQQKPVEKTVEKETPKTTEKQEHLAEKEIEEPKEEFYETVKRYFNKNNIVIKDLKILRKKSDYEFIVTMQTPFGEAEYFCKAKNKKKSSDGDLSTAYIQGQTRRLPVIYLTTGEVAKKAKEKIKTDYKGMLVKEL